MKKKKYLAIFMAMSMATATAPVTALADDATTGTESGAETGESGSGETGSTGETGSENGGTEGGSTTAPDTPAENEGVKTIDELNAAITAAGETETTIKLAADITGDVVVPEKANITIYLNGKKITNSVGHTIMNNGTLTIKGEGTVDNITHGKAALYNKGTVTLNGGTFDRTQENGKSDSSSGGNSYYTIKNVGNMTINEGVNVLTAKGNGELGRFSSLVANGYYNGTTYDNDKDKGVDNPTLIINNGTFSGGLNTIKNDDRAELTINDGTFKNFYQATVQNHNIATINGGTYKAASDASSTGKETYGVYNCGCDANIDLGTLTVTGGIFEGADYAIADVSSQTAVVNISGGSFSGAKGAVKGTNSNAIISISGGVFDSNVQAYAADGYKAIQVTGDKYVVTNEIALDKKSTRIRRGYTDTLKAIVEANGKTYDVAAPITWASDKESVATVKDGVVTGVDYGTATITATLGTTTETPDTTETPATQAEDDTATGGDAVTDGDNTTTSSNTLKASCTVDVYKKSSSGSSSGGGGGSSAAKHGVTISDSKHGAVTASAAKAETGDKVILTPKADEGYELDKITAKDKDGKEVKLKAEKDGTYSFTMPKGGVTVDTTFKQAEGATNTDKPAAAAKTIILQIGSTAVLVDDQAIINDVAPVIRNDRTLVPIRVITEALGGQVAWNEAAKEVTLTVNGKEIKMTIGKALEKYGVAPVIIGGRTFVPVRFVADELGAVTTWDDATKTVTIQAVK